MTDLIERTVFTVAEQKQLSIHEAVERALDDHRRAELRLAAELNLRKFIGLMREHDVPAVHIAGVKWWGRDYSEPSGEVARNAYVIPQRLVKWKDHLQDDSIPYFVDDNMQVYQGRGSIIFDTAGQVRPEMCGKKEQNCGLERQDRDDPHLHIELLPVEGGELFATEQGASLLAAQIGRLGITAA